MSDATHTAHQVRRLATYLDEESSRVVILYLEQASLKVGKQRRNRGAGILHSRPCLFL